MKKDYGFQNLLTSPREMACISWKAWRVEMFAFYGLVSFFLLTHGKGSFLRLFKTFI